MFPDIQCSTSQYFLIAAAVIAVIFALVVGMKFYFRRRSGSDLTFKYKDRKWASPLEARVKYPDIDVFRWQPTFFWLSGVLVLVLMVGGINITLSDDGTYVPENALAIPDDIEIELPRTELLPPPPPPPPPLAIEAVPDDIVMKDESPEFLDQSVTTETVVEAAPVQEGPREKVAPPPPPPPKQVEEIFKVVEQMPRFPGCEDIAGTDKEKQACAEKIMLKFIYDNIRYPNMARENGVEGTVVAQFVVDTDGKIVDLKIVRDIGGQCGEEVLRIVKMMPDWIPGKQRGRAVKVQFNLPVKFELASQS